MRTESAKAAQMIKKHLKANGIKCTAKSSNYSGGSSIRVSLENELPATVKLVNDYCEQYSYATFDGMTDCQGIKNQGLDIPQAGYVFVNCDYSDEIRQAAYEYGVARYDMSDAPAKFNDFLTFEQNRLYMDVLNGVEGNFWAAYKPRVAA